MKKTITINLWGMVFSIDEDAYQLLYNYLQSVGDYYANENASSEILEDIEARMAELFRDRMGGNRQVITYADVEAVIAIMGYPEDFMADGATASSSYTSHTRYRRIYRDPDNRVLGGVCAGMGAYFSLDPLLFRILFLVLVLAGGSGILLYLILWIVIPEARTTAQKLEMKGEPVNVSNIGKKAKEQFNRVKDKMNL